MKLRVELTWGGGIVDDQDQQPQPEPHFDLVDDDTGKPLLDRSFPTCAEMEAYIAERYPDCERWVPPPPSPKEAATLEQVLRLIDQSVLDPRVGGVRCALIGHLYQSGYPPETVSKLRTLLGLPQ